MFVTVNESQPNKDIAGNLHPNKNPQFVTMYTTDSVCLTVHQKANKRTNANVDLSFFGQIDLPGKLIGR